MFPNPLFWASWCPHDVVLSDLVNATASYPSHCASVQRNEYNILQLSLMLHLTSCPDFPSALGAGICAASCECPVPVCPSEPPGLTGCSRCVPSNAPYFIHCPSRLWCHVCSCLDRRFNPLAADRRSLLFSPLE